ncbi:MAG TPA: hypothetical protein VKP30_04755 [Polyangiaceae bacterium]|nr:hypothetical protein [Polyangiaceae bacterium]
MRTHVIRVAVLGALCAAVVVGCKKQKPKPPEPDLEFEELRSNLVQAALVNLTNPRVEQTNPQLVWSPEAQSERAGVLTPLAAQAQSDRLGVPTPLAVADVRVPSSGRDNAAQDNPAQEARSPSTDEKPTVVQSTRASPQEEPDVGPPPPIARSPSETVAEQQEEARKQSGASVERTQRSLSNAQAAPLDAAAVNSPTVDARVAAGAEEPQQAADVQVAAEEPQQTADAQVATEKLQQTSETQVAGETQREAAPPASDGSQTTDQVARERTAEAKQTMQTEAAVRRAIASAFSAMYGAGSGFTGDSAGLNGYTGIGAGSGYTGVGAGSGSTGIGAGPGHTGFGAGPGYTGVGAGQGFTGVTAGSWGSTGIAGSRAPATNDAASTASPSNTEATSTATTPSSQGEQRNRPDQPRVSAVVWLSPWGPVLLPVGY